MIVERITWLAKVGCHAEVIKILKELNQQLGVNCTERIYSCEFGADDESVAIELEFESMEHRRACWGKWFKQPEAHEATARMRALIRSGGVHQVWRLH
jgi:hypothetical protein